MSDSPAQPNPPPHLPADDEEDGSDYRVEDDLPGTHAQPGGEGDSGRSGDDNNKTGEDGADDDYPPPPGPGGDEEGGGRYRTQSPVSGGQHGGGGSGVGAGEGRNDDYGYNYDYHPNHNIRSLDTLAAAADANSSSHSGNVGSGANVNVNNSAYGQYLGGMGGEMSGLGGMASELFNQAHAQAQGQDGGRADAYGSGETYGLPGGNNAYAQHHYNAYNLHQVPSAFAPGVAGMLAMQASGGSADGMNNGGGGDGLEGGKVGKGVQGGVEYDGETVVGGANAKLDIEKDRKRIMQACEGCRVRKAKCNGLQPCNRCSTRKLVCSYAHERKMRGPNKVKKTPQEKAAARAERLAKQQRKQREAAGVYDNGNNGMGMGMGVGQDMNGLTGVGMGMGMGMDAGTGYGRDVRSVGQGQGQGQNDYTRTFGGVPDSAGSQGRGNNQDGSGYNNPPYSAGSASSFHQSQQSGYNPYPTPNSNKDSMNTNNNNTDYYSSFSRGGGSGHQSSGPGNGGQENYDASAGGGVGDDRARGQTSNARFDADGGMASPGRQEGSQGDLGALFMPPGGAGGLHAGGGDGEQWD